MSPAAHRSCRSAGAASARASNRTWSSTPLHPPQTSGSPTTSGAARLLEVSHSWNQLDGPRAADTRVEQAAALALHDADGVAKVTAARGDRGSVRLDGSDANGDVDFLARPHERRNDDDRVGEHLARGDVAPCLERVDFVSGR